MECAQKIVNGSVRAFEDGKKMSANVILAIKERYLLKTPATITPGMKLLLDESCQDARQAVQSVVIPDVTESLLSLIELGLRFAEEDSMVPRVVQGLSSEGKETAFEVGKRAEMAGKYMANVVRNFDEYLIEPIVTDFYDWNMGDPMLTRGKGSYTVKALGFTSYQDRVDRIDRLMKFAQIVFSNESFAREARAHEFVKEIATALDCDPDQYLKSEEEKQAEAEADAQNPDLELERAEKTAKIKKTEAEAEATLAGIEIDAAKMELEIGNDMDRDLQGLAGAKTKSAKAA